MELIITGWSPGLQAISLIDVLRANCGMGLRQAKNAVDGLLDGTEIRIPNLSDEAATILRDQVEALGAICR